MSTLTPDERRSYAAYYAAGYRLSKCGRLWEAYVALEANERHRGNDLLACHEIIAGAWEALGNLVPKDGEGTLGEEIAKALKAAQSAEAP